MPAKGTKLSEESKQKISNSKKGSTPWNKGVPQTEDHRQKNRESKIGLHHTEESRKKMSIQRKGIPKSAETRQRMSESKTGHNVSDITRNKISITKRK